MSVKVMSWVWDSSKSRKISRLVLLGIADCASDDGANAYPSTATLARKCGISERSVQAAVGDLVGLGELVVEPNAGPRGTNRYRVVMTPAESAPPQNLHPPAESAPPQDLRRAKGTRRGKAQQKPPQNLHPEDSAPPQDPHHPPADSADEPSLNRPTNSSSKSSSKRGTRIPDDFKVTPEMVAWAREHVPNVDGRRETEKFVNYWQAKTGRDATKLDWVATWRNWLMNAADRGARTSNGSSWSGPYKNPTDPDAYRKGL